MNCNVATQAVVMQSAAEFFIWIPAVMKYPLEPEFPIVLKENLKKYSFKLVREGKYNEDIIKNLLVKEYAKNVEQLNAAIYFEGDADSFWFQSLFNECSVRWENSPIQLYRKQLVESFLVLEPMMPSKIYNVGEYNLKLNIRNAKESIHVIALIRLDGRKYPLFLPFQKGKKPTYSIPNLYFCEADQMFEEFSAEIFQQALTYFSANIEHPIEEPADDLSPTTQQMDAQILQCGKMSPRLPRGVGNSRGSLLKPQLFLENSKPNQEEGLNYESFEKNFLLPGSKELHPLNCGVFDVLERAYWTRKNNRKCKTEVNNFPSIEAAYFSLSGVWTHLIRADVIVDSFRKAFGEEFCTRIQSPNKGAAENFNQPNKVDSCSSLSVLAYEQEYISLPSTPFNVCFFYLDTL